MSYLFVLESSSGIQLLWIDTPFAVDHIAVWHPFTCNCLRMIYPSNILDLLQAPPLKQNFCYGFPKRCISHLESNNSPETNRDMVLQGLSPSLVSESCPLHITHMAIECYWSVQFTYHFQYILCLIYHSIAIHWLAIHIIPIDIPKNISLSVIVLSF